MHILVAFRAAACTRPGNRAYLALKAVVVAWSRSNAARTGDGHD